VLKYENGLCSICICVCTPETKEAEGSHEGMNYANIKEFDIADGPGVRVSLFVSGCRHHCKGCFNAMTWDFNYGEPFDDSIADRIIEALKPDFIQGFTLLGGEPFEPENQAVLAGLLKRIRSTYPKKDIWCYTGYTYDVDLVPGGKVYTPYTDEMLACTDCLVDGEFVEALKDVNLTFRGSSNQRLIGLHGYEPPKDRKPDHKIKHFDNVNISTRTSM